jgi:polysaccharide biosynthesis transport protein
MTISQVLRAVRGRWKLCAGVFFGVVLATLAASLLMPKTYTAVTSIVVDPRRTDPVSGNVNSGQLVPGYLNTQIDIIRSLGVALKVVDALNVHERPDVRRRYEDEARTQGDIKHWVAENVLQKALAIQPARDSNVIRISYESSDPKFAAEVASAFAQAYITRTLELRVEPAKQTSAWFDEQLKTSLRENLEQAVARLTEFQRKHGIVATDERLDVENARLLELSAQLVSAQSLTYEQQSRQNQMGAMRAQGISGSVPDVVANPVVQRLKADIAVAETRLNELSTRLGANHPEYQAVQDQIAGLRKRLDAEVSVIASSVRSASSAASEREAALRQAVADQKSRVMALKQQGNELAVLMRDVDSAQRAYDTALQRVSQTRLEAQVDQTNVAIVSPAFEPLLPSRPRVLLNMLLAVVIGLGLAPAIAVIREMADRRIRSRDDIRTLFAIPVLGETPSPNRLRIGRAGKNALAAPPTLGAIGQ